jgi:alpha-tubulin suppressor-like RCC1 family protein
MVKFLDGLTPVAQVSCGANHSAFLDTSGRLYTCGMGEQGQLGHGHCDKLTHPKQVVKINEQVAMVACGQTHTLVLTYDIGHVYSFGSNTYG